MNRCPERTRNFSVLQTVRTGSGAHPASIQKVPRLFLWGEGVKRPGHESDHSSPSSAEVKEGVELYPRSSYTPSYCVQRQPTGGSEIGAKICSSYRHLFCISKSLLPSVQVHGVIYQKIADFILISVRTSSVTISIILFKYSSNNTAGSATTNEC